MWVIVPLKLSLVFSILTVIYSMICKLMFYAFLNFTTFLCYADNLSIPVFTPQGQPFANLETILNVGICCKWEFDTKGV